MPARGATQNVRVSCCPELLGQKKLENSEVRAHEVGHLEVDVAAICLARAICSSLWLASERRLHLVLMHGS